MPRYAIPQLSAFALAVATCATVLPTHAQSQTATPAPAWPVKPLRIVVPFPWGGTSDILARLIGQKLTEAWGQQLLVDSRAGANGSIGTDIVVRAPPDGYTILLTDVGGLMISPFAPPKAASNR